MNTSYFYKSFLRKVRSHLGEPARLTGPAHLHMSSLSVDLQLYREALAQVFSCKFCKIRKNIFFAEHHRTTASDYSSISISEGRIGKRNCKLWYKNYSIYTNLCRQWKLLKSAVQVNEHVSEAVVRRLQIRCSYKFRKLYRKASVMESLFNKVAWPKSLQLC